MNNCPEPHKQQARNKFLEMDISAIIAKAIATTLNDREKQKEAKADVNGFLTGSMVKDTVHTPLNQLFLSSGKLYGRVYQGYVRLECTTID